MVTPSDKSYYMEIKDWNAFLCVIRNKSVFQCIQCIDQFNRISIWRICVNQCEYTSPELFRYINAKCILLLCIHGVHANEHVNWRKLRCLSKEKMGCGQLVHKKTNGHKSLIRKARSSSTAGELKWINVPLFKLYQFAFDLCCSWFVSYNNALSFRYILKQKEKKRKKIQLYY
jgi:hypothetical protein